jgi:hypothetical protein
VMGFAKGASGLNALKAIGKCACQHRLLTSYLRSQREVTNWLMDPYH